MAISRSWIAKVTLPSSVGFLGKEHNVMVVHMHNDLANNVLGAQKLFSFWGWLWDKIKTYRVQVLMGDFNMSLFRVIPELRNRGVTIDLGAWYPWKSLEGEPMSDSCGIFFVNLPGMYTLDKKLGDLHDKDPTGVLSRGLPVGASAAVAETFRSGGYDLIEANGGPGMPFKTYLPKQNDLAAEIEDAKAKLTPSLTPSTQSAAVAASRERDRKAGGIKLR